MKQGMRMKRALWGMLMAGLLASCGPHLWSRTERSLPCPCPPDCALAYAVQATHALLQTPVFREPARLNVTLSNPDGYTMTKLDIAIKPTGASTSVVRVRAEAAEPAKFEAE